MPFEHFYKQSDAIKFSSCLILLSKQDTKKPISSWASFQMFFFPTVHILTEVTLALPSIKSPNSSMFISSGVGHFLTAYMQTKRKRCAGAPVVLVISSSIPTSGMEPPSPRSQVTGSEQDGQLPSQWGSARTGHSAQRTLQAGVQGWTIMWLLQEGPGRNNSVSLGNYVNKM